MKRVAPYDRPREKLDRLGAGSLGDNELLALVLGHGAVGTSSLELANLVLTAAGGLHGLARASARELRRVPGIGAARGAQLIAALEVGRRTLLRQRDERQQVRSPADAAALLLPEFGSRPVEHFGAILLDTKLRVLRVALLSVGTLDASIVHPRELFREAVLGGAAAVMLFHNHPSGDPTPSPDDVVLTRRLIDAGQLMGIAVVDHVILAENRFRSLRTAGDLDDSVRRT